MYIITYPSSSEFNNSPSLKYLEDWKAVQKFILEYHGDLKRVRFFEAKEVVLSVSLSEKDDGKES